MRIVSIRVLVLFFCFFVIGAGDGISAVSGIPEVVRNPGLDSEAAHLKVEDYVQELAPERIHIRTARQVIKYLTERHYRKLAVDNRLSERLFDRYLSDLDFNRIYFLEGDISSFAVFRHELDDTLEIGNMRPAFEIYNRYQRHVVERLVFLISLIDRGFDGMDLNRQETLETERKNAPWPPDMKALKDLWRKWLKNDVLNRKLAGKTLKEIAGMLGKRYRSQLNRIRQTNSEDVFRLYMNALGSIFDPHTQYFSPRMSENFKIQMSLSLEGIGAVLQTENEHTKVVRLVPAGPADKGKALMPGDRIVGVGQGIGGEIVDVVGWRLDDVVQLIRGSKGTVVRLEIHPAGIDDDYKTRIISITRNTVKLEEQAAQKRLMEIEHEGGRYNIGVIDIPTFYLDFKAYHEGLKNYRSTTRDVHRLLKELTDADVDGVIVDLRDNGGGALQEASDLTGLFIKEGPTVQVRNSRRKISSLFDEDPGIVYRGPVVVLVNRLSASAAEIFAGAIQDYHRGIITGSPTFGKGTVQSLLDLKHGQLKLTVAKFYRVSGESTQNQGVIPDIKYPPVYDFAKIGESALPDALPWGKIHPVSYHPYPDLNLAIDHMRARHDSRKSTSPDFAYLNASIARLKESRQQTLLPLEEKARKQLFEEREQRRLSVENTRRIAKGLKPLEKMEDIDEEKTGEENGSTKENGGKPDPLLIESGHILADLITLSAKKSN